MRNAQYKPAGRRALFFCFATQEFCQHSTENEGCARSSVLGILGWENDYTFVVETTGTDERTWLANVGHPHSVGMHVTEHYKRRDHNDLQVEVKIDDPKTYTKPFIITTANFKWIPKQDFEEQICIGSDELDYLKILLIRPLALRPPRRK